MAQTSNVWDSLAQKYDGLWVQKYSLNPTRRAVKTVLAQHLKNSDAALLDLGCGTGQLLCELEKNYPDAILFGADKSVEMIRAAQDKLSGSTLYNMNIDTDNLPKVIQEDTLDAIVCCHSFPYYQNKPAVLEKLYKALKTDGILIFAQASANNLYDRFVLSFVVKTAESGEYLPRRNFRDLVSPHFTIKSEFSVKERFFMPSICGFVLEKRL